jgi:hypothetical protein
MKNPEMADASLTIIQIMAYPADGQQVVRMRDSLFLELIAPACLPMGIGTTVPICPAPVEQAQPLKSSERTHLIPFTGHPDRPFRTVS